MMPTTVEAVMAMSTNSTNENDALPSEEITFLCITALCTTFNCVTVVVEFNCFFKFINQRAEEIVQTVMAADRSNHNH